jgi:hypothetical protein
MYYYSVRDTGVRYILSHAWWFTYTLDDDHVTVFGEMMTMRMLVFILGGCGFFQVAAEFDSLLACLLACALFLQAFK